MDDRSESKDPSRIMSKHPKRWHTVVYLIWVTMLLSALAFVNRYPFVYSDTGTYVRCAFTLLPVVDRPIGYSFIIRAVTWQSTLWTVVLFQSGMIAWLLYEVVRKMLPPGVLVWRVHLLLIGVLMLCTSLPWYTTQIMPDVLTPMIALVLYLLLFAPELGIWKKGFLWVCLFFFLIAHNSHVAMMALLLVGLALFGVLRRHSLPVRNYWIGLGGTAAVLVAGVMYVTWYNGRHGLPERFSPAANVFLAGRLSENRLLCDFLDKRCEERNYPLCPYRAELPDVPGDFLWMDNNIASRLNRDMVVADSLLAPMVHDLLTSPEYLGRYVRSCIVSTVVQFFQVNTNSGIVSFHRDSSPYINIAERLRWESSSYITSYQAYNDWDLQLVDRVVHVAFFLALFVLIWTLPEWWGRAELRLFVVLMFAWVLLNAAVTSSLANVYDRLQSRVAWMIVLLACLALLRTRLGQRLLDSPVFKG